MVNLPPGIVGFMTIAMMPQVLLRVLWSSLREPWHSLGSWPRQYPDGRKRNDRMYWRWGARGPPELRVGRPAIELSRLRQDREWEISFPTISGKPSPIEREDVVDTELLG